MGRKPRRRQNPGLPDVADPLGVTTAELETVRVARGSGGRLSQDQALPDTPKRPCNRCGKPFQPTIRRRRLCSPCFRGDWLEI